MPDFGTRLKAERARLGLSQAAMAEAGGVSLNSQSNYENGHRVPDASYLERVASLGVDVTYVVIGVRVSAALTAAPAGQLADGAVLRSVTPEEAALLDNYEHSDDEGRAAARRLLSALAVSSPVRKAA